jgi:hypothetical protein
MSSVGMFVAIVGGMLFIFAIFALGITPFVICPPTMEHTQTAMGDPIVQLCNFVNHK